MRLRLRLADERGHDALHAHEARTLDQNRVATFGFAKKIRHQCIDAREMRGLRSKGFDRGGRELTDGEEMLDTRLACVFADLAVESGTHCADFAHVAQHEPAISARLCEDV